jgi:acetyl esterase/lipase
MKTLKKCKCLKIEFFIILLISIFIIPCRSQNVSEINQANYDPICQDVIVLDSILPGGAYYSCDSEGSILTLLVNYPTGKGPHPTLIILHGFTSMAGYADIATTINRAGWNVVFFRYRGCWGMPGEFSFQNCVEDAINVTAFCKKNSDSLNIDTTRIVYFGHSMGGWVALKAASQFNYINKLFLLSAWDIYNGVVNLKKENLFDSYMREVDSYSEIKISSTVDLFNPVIEDSSNFILTNYLEGMKNKSIYMLDEHNENKNLADALNKYAKNVKYIVWNNTNHFFTNTHIAMMRELLSFLNE